ncbi:DUF1444 family protein [Prosthecodimorpha staleyi]|uniref:DUF1444 family protein n=1 Tax=Prosthecodimorpha staleyi TaxID=2840188 RepID=A0A947D1I4_9HYPH|nr:DUF1444 family protein [Prosthecodimorpha staleyi]MBT9288548.1 DUF1444 family protein [Prosthecodimorpha staleyi]
MQIARRRLFVAGLLSSMIAWLASALAKGRAFKDVGELRAAVMVSSMATQGIGKVLADPNDRAKFTAVVNGETCVSDVTNLFGYLSAYPDENADEAIARFVRAILTCQKAPIKDDSIVAIIRTRGYVEETKRLGLSVLHEPIGADLFVVYMADKPDSMSPLDAKDPHKPLRDLRVVSLENVRKWLPHLIADRSLGVGILYYVNGNTMLSPSLLLLDEFWTSIADRFPGDVLFAIPRRDQLFIFDEAGASKNEEVARRLIKLTIDDGFNLLSPQLYARRNGRIVAVSN